MKNSEVEDIGCHCSFFKEDSQFFLLLYKVGLLLKFLFWFKKKKTEGVGSLCLAELSLGGFIPRP